MAKTFVNYAIVPTTDDGTNTADPTAITPPSMQAGDLVILWATGRAGSLTLAISQAGGQSWSSFYTNTSTNITSGFAFCTFNGTWSANPSVSFGSTTCNSVSMLVFRPDGGTSSKWKLNLTQSVTTFAAPGSPYTVTITGQTTSKACVAVAGWSTTDNNTWGTLSGTGWSKTSLPAQNRNSSGQDTSQTWAYNIQSSSGATNNVSQNQATLGGDLGVAFIACFEEYKEISLTGFAETEEFGTQKANINCKPTGFAEVEEFGSQTIQKTSPQTVNMTGNGFAEVEEFGGAKTRRTLPGLTGFAEAEQFGTQKLSFRLPLSGFAEAEQFGMLVVRQAQFVTLTGFGFAEAEQFGSPRVNFRLFPQGFAEQEEFGNIAKFNRGLPLTGFAEVEAFGDMAVQTAAGPQSIDLTGHGFSEVEQFGTTVTRRYLTLAGFAEVEQFGAQRIRMYVLPQGFAESEYVGAPELRQEQFITTTGFAEQEEFGLVVLRNVVGLQIQVEGFAETEMFGNILIYMGEFKAVIFDVFPLVRTFDVEPLRRAQDVEPTRRIFDVERRDRYA